MRIVSIIIDAIFGAMAFILLSWVVFTPLPIPLIILLAIGMCSGYTFGKHVSSVVALTKISDDDYKKLIDEKAKKIYNQ